MSPLSGEALKAGFLDTLGHQRRLSPHTLRAYAATIDRLLAFVQTAHGRPADSALLESMEAADWRAYLARRRGDGLANASAAREQSALRTFARWAFERHGLAIRGLDMVERPRVKRRLPRPMAPDEAVALARVTGEAHAEPWVQARDEAVLLLLYGAGLRIGEALGLTGAVLPLGETLAVEGKGRKVRLVAILPVVAQAVSAYARLCPWPLGRDTPLFYGARGGPLDPGVLRAALRKARVALGLPDHATPHALRHSFATHLLARGADLRTIQDLLGHASLSSTQVYTAVDTAHLLDVWQASHPRGEARRQG
jgi:integrase/recombinase XerC